jgi:hypothetical protein
MPAQAVRNGGSARSEPMGGRLLGFPTSSRIDSNEARVETSVLPVQAVGPFAVVKGKTLDTLNPLKTREATLLRPRDQAPPNSGANRIPEGHAKVNSGSGCDAPYAHESWVDSNPRETREGAPRTDLSCVANCNYACSIGQIGLQSWAFRCAASHRAPRRDRRGPTQEIPPDASRLEDQRRHPLLQ